MAKVFPVLHNPDAFNCDQFASRYLVDTPNDVPIVSYLQMCDDGSTKYISWKMVERSKRPGLKALNAKAMTDLTHRPDRPGWNRKSLKCRGNDITVLERVGDFLTASDIMDPEILQIAHHCLGSDEIYIGIPHACYMVAARRPEHLSEAFGSAYEEASLENAQYFEVIYRVQDENLVELVPCSPTLMGPEFRKSDDAKVMWFTLPYRGDFNLLKYYLIHDLPEIIPNFLRLSGFKGNIVVDIPRNSHKFTLGQCQELARLEGELNMMSRERGWLTYECTCTTIQIFYKQKERAKRGIRTSVFNMLQGV